MTYHSIYLMAVDWDQRAAAAQAVHRARKALGQDNATHGGAFEAVQACHDGSPVPIGNAMSEGVLALAKQALDAAGSALSYAVDPTPEEVLDPSGEGRRATLRAVQDFKADAAADEAEAKSAGENDGPFTPEEYETAMLLIVAARGNPFFALSVAGGLTHTTRSDSYKRVQACILKVFPADSPQAMALVAQVIEDE